MAYTRRPFNPLSRYANQVVSELNRANDNFDTLAKAFQDDDPSTLIVKHADMVDGFHASQTPTANTIPVSNSSGILEAGWLRGYDAKLYAVSCLSSQITTSNNTIYNLCSIIVPPQPVVPPRGFWYVLAFVSAKEFGVNNTAAGYQEWRFRVVRRSDNYAFNIGYVYMYKSAPGSGGVGARGMAYLGNLNRNQSETYTLQLAQGAGNYNITVNPNAVDFYILLI